jgi:hypothetical protein
MTATRPSVVFLNELREVISVMPLADPRTVVLHQSLRVFPADAVGGLDFAAADQLVTMMMPSLQPSRGVEARLLARFPRVTFGSIFNEACRRGETECCICLDTFRNEDELLTLPCFHFFHASCVSTWLGNHVSCPICKFDVSSS